jgi:hypothetical protein
MPDFIERFGGLNAEGNPILSSSRQWLSPLCCLPEPLCQPFNTHLRAYMSIHLN